MLRKSLVLLLLASRSASGQAPQPAVEFTGDLGFVNTSGNSEVTTINVGEKLKVNGGPVAFSQFFSVVYGRSEGETITSSWRGGVRGDLKVSTRLSLFSLGAWDRNRFAGITRRFEEAIGVRIDAVKTETTRLELEGGVSLIQQLSTTGTHKDFAAGRAALLARRTFHGKSYVQQTAEFFPNLKDGKDFRLNTESSLVAPISDHIGLKLSYVIRFDNEPEPTFEKTDRLLTAGIQVTF